MRSNRDPRGWSCSRCERSLVPLGRRATSVNYPLAPHSPMLEQPPMLQEPPMLEQPPMLQEPPMPQEPPMLQEPVVRTATASPMSHMRKRLGELKR